MKEGLESVKVLEMNRDINGAILRRIEYVHPSEVLRDLIE